MGATGTDQLRIKPPSDRTDPWNVLLQTNPAENASTQLVQSGCTLVGVR